MKHLWNSQRLSHSQHPPSRSHSVWSWGERKESIYLAKQNQEPLSQQIKYQKKWRWANYILASELFKEQTSQSTYTVTFTLTWVRMCIRWRNSMTKFDDAKFSDESPWQTFSEIFDCWARMMLFSVRWSLGKDALPIERICDYKALVLSVVVVIFFIAS